MSSIILQTDFHSFVSLLHLHSGEYQVKQMCAASLKIKVKGNAFSMMQSSFQVNTSNVWWEVTVAKWWEVKRER